MPQDDYRAIEFGGEFFVFNPMWTGTGSQYYAGPFTERQAQDFARSCNEWARRWMRANGQKAGVDQK